MDAAQRLAANESLEGLDSEGKLTRRQRAFRTHVSGAQAIEVLRSNVLGSVDDAQILPATALQCRLGQAARAAHGKFEWLDDYPLAASARQLLPPADCRILTFLVSYVNLDIARGDEEF